MTEETTDLGFEKEKVNEKYIEALKKILICEKKFKCFDQGFENLCKAKDGGPLGTVYCREKNSEECLFSMTLGFDHLCKCPIRIHLIKELKK